MNKTVKKIEDLRRTLSYINFYLANKSCEAK